MDSTIIILLAIILVLAVSLVFFYLKLRKLASFRPVGATYNETRNLQLQAYERLTLLTDRVALPNLLSRINREGLSAKELQLLLLQTIRQEFDYNITQQVYVSADAWSAVKNLKEQNLLIINQVASMLPDNANAYELSKVLLEYAMKDEKGNMHTLVSEALSYEAKKLL
ncbi:MAG: hypothetical protein KGO81_04815 [Bacteroidota bacterium]|nr:hypothetical protein [Bacteroidota bacterium]